VVKNLSAQEPLIYCQQRAPQEEKWRLGGIQSKKPPAERGWIRYAMGIFQMRRRLFPRTALYEMAP
jgi:hypothetical protein